MGTWIFLGKKFLAAKPDEMWEEREYKQEVAKQLSTVSITFSFTPFPVSSH